MSSLLVQQAYGRRAAEYAQLLGTVDAMEPADRSLIERWAAAVDGCIADVGCGPGHWTNFIRGLGQCVYGLDPTPEFIELAQSAYPDAEVRQGSFSDLSESTVGGMLARYSLIHHQPTAVETELRRCSNALRPEPWWHDGREARTKRADFSHPRYDAPMAPTIRPATEADLPVIVDIYNEAGVGTTASYDLEPVTLEDRLVWFQRLQARDFPVLVLEVDGAVVGYSMYGQFRDKAGYDHTVEHSVYIAAGHRAEGGGRLLMGALIDYARGHGVHVMVGVLDASNEASVAFHERLGFARSAVLPQVGRKFGRWLDVIYMTLILGE